ncbi:hypothetical protein Droror1_Dr00025822 [Drosera rotundifolia]
MTSLFSPSTVLLPREELPQGSGHVRAKERTVEHISLLKNCKNMDELRQVHAQMLKMGLLSNPFCVSNLVFSSALPAWGDMEYAYSIFQRIEEPSTSDFNAMIKGHVKELDFEEALVVFEEMLERGVVANRVTYPSVLKACAKLGWVERGRQVHGQVLKRGFRDDVLVQNSLISMYGKCRRVSEACSVFGLMEENNGATWSSLIAALAKSSMWWDCLEMFRDMNHNASCKVDDSTLACVLSACAHLGTLVSGKCIHGYLLRNFSGENVIVQTSLIDMYVKCGHLGKGLHVFKRMGWKNQLTYAVIISGLAAFGHAHEAFRCFEKMLEDGIKPDDAVYVGLLVACQRGILVEEGFRLFDQMRLEHGIEPHVEHYGCIVGLLGRAGLFEKALKWIEEMPMKHNDTVWRSLLSAAKRHHDLEIAEIAARKLDELGLMDGGDYVILANMYARDKRWDKVETVRTMMASKGLAQVPGFCFVEVQGTLHKFHWHDKTHPRCDEIYEMIHQMEWQLKFEGYSPDTSEIPINFSEEEKRQRLKHHCQKLAIAYALLYTPKDTTIRITRNVRMCSDCHKYTKLVSRIYHRNIIVQERNVFHHFRDETCSCNDHW